MIVVESLLDWKHSRGRLHGDEGTQESPLHTVSYLGVLHQAFRDLSHWVEGVAPRARTNDEVVDGQVVVPDDASYRCGIQPVVSLTVNGGARADVKAGEVLTFRATAQVPRNTKFIVGIEWDFDGCGLFPVAEHVEAAPSVHLERRLTLDDPGTSFPAVRVMAHVTGARPARTRGSRTSHAFESSCGRFRKGARLPVARRRIVSW